MFNYPEAGNTIKAYPNDFLRIFDAINNGLLDNGSDLTISSNTFAPPLVIAKTLTIDSGKTLSFLGSGSYNAGGVGLILAKSVVLNGNITISGSNIGNDDIGYIPIFTRVGILPTVGISVYKNNGALFGGNQVDPSSYYLTSIGGGGTVASPNLYKPFFVKERLLTDSADYASPGERGTLAGMGGGGVLVILSQVFTMGASSSLLANGIHYSGSGTGGGGGGIGIVANVMTFTSGAVVSANGGNSDSSNYGTGGGTITIISRTTKTGAATKTVNGGTSSYGNGEAGSIIDTVWDFLAAI